MQPVGAWESLYEPLIRRAAGLGRAPTERDPDHYAISTPIATSRSSAPAPPASPRRLPPRAAARG